MLHERKETANQRFYLETWNVEMYTGNLILSNKIAPSDIGNFIYAFGDFLDAQQAN